MAFVWVHEDAVQGEGSGLCTSQELHQRNLQESTSSSCTRYLRTRRTVLPFARRVTKPTKHLGQDGSFLWLL
jgi:hypothetical protein